MARTTRWKLRLAAACVALAALAAADPASAQVSVRFGDAGIGVGARNGYSYGAGVGSRYGLGSRYGYGSRYGDAGRLNPYRSSGYNPYLGGGYARDSRDDWYYDTYRPRGYGAAGRLAAPNWRTYREPSLYAPSGIYHGYGYGD